MTTIFYQNSVGIMCQWKGEVTKEATSVIIKFSKNKRYRYDLTQSGFLLVTKKPMKAGFLESITKGDVLSFDDSLVERIKTATEGNTEIYWNGRKWEGE